MASANSYAPEGQLHEWEHLEAHETHEWEWQHPEMEYQETGESEDEWEWETDGGHEADPFLPFLLPLAAKALPAIGRAVMPAVRKLIPMAKQAIGTTIRNVLGPDAPSGPPATRRGPAARSPSRAGAGRPRALHLVRQLHGIILRGEAEAEAAEAAFFGTAEMEWESGHPSAYEAALTEVLAAEAAHTASEAEAEALLGAAMPITISIMGGRRRMRPLTPSLVRANTRLVRGLRRSGPAGPQLLRLVPKIQRNSVAAIRQLQRSGRQVPPSMVAPIVAASAARVLGTPSKCGPALVRNTVVRQRTVAPPRPRRRHSAY
ncbi:MAG: hypothetical protein ABSA02_04460 [Trebonia sp.]|jgi:hypothetical protein